MPEWKDAVFYPVEDDNPEKYYTELDKAPLYSFQARLSRPADLHNQNVKRVLYFSTFKQVLIFARFYHKKFSGEYVVRKWRDLFIKGSTYLQDDMYNEYIITLYKF